MKYEYKFKLETKPYCTPDSYPTIDTVGEQLINSILNKDDDTLEDAFQYITNSILDMYYDDLINTNTVLTFSEYIARAIYEFDLMPEDDGSAFIATAIRWAESLYYNEQTENNIDTIVQNALVSYVNSITLTSDIVYDADELKKFIVTYIEELSVDVSDRVSSIIEDFNNELLSKFDVKIN